jgi:ABC-type nitrate/sulfonate/bicarbonate transport system permease component
MSANAARSRRRPLLLSPAARRGVVGLLGFAALLELAPRVGLVSSEFLPPFSEIIGTLVGQLGTPAFWQALGSTTLGWFTGLAIAALAGIGVGVLIGSSRWLRDITHSTIEFLRPIPSVALIPIAVIMFGTDMKSTLVLVVYATFWQVLIQVLAGVQDVDPIARETARSYRFGWWTQMRTVAWPTALPYVITGIRLGVAVALILEITGELVIGSPGLGRQIALAQTAGQVSLMYALVIVAGILGVVMNVATRALERRALRWHVSVRLEVGR